VPKGQRPSPNPAQGNALGNPTPKPHSTLKGPNHSSHRLARPFRADATNDIPSPGRCPGLGIVTPFGRPGLWSKFVVTRLPSILPTNNRFLDWDAPRSGRVESIETGRTTEWFHPLGVLGALGERSSLKPPNTPKARQRSAPSLRMASLGNLATRQCSLSTMEICGPGGGSVGAKERLRQRAALHGDAAKPSCPFQYLGIPKSRNPEIRNHRPKLPLAPTSGTSV